MNNVPKDGQQDVDEEVCAATSLKEDTKRWEEDGEDNLTDVAGETLALFVPAITPEWIHCIWDHQG